MVIDSFDGEYEFLSNFALSPISYQNKKWTTVEHLFQAEKSFDEVEREQVRLANSPGKAKRLGRKVSLRKDWQKVKRDVMLKCVQLKFEQNAEFGKLLIDTGDATLVEGNSWHDNIWGSCSCSKCKNKTGRNLLGQILMQVRDELKHK